MKTLILLFAILLTSCSTIKTIPDFTIGQEHFEGSQIMYRNGKAVQWRSKSHPCWTKVDTSNIPF